MIHWELIDERCYRVIAETSQLMEGHGIPYVLGGGWAVFTYSPRTPSVDTDLLLSRENQTVAKKILVKNGFHVGQHEEIEFLDLEEKVGFWAYGDEDLGIPTPGFRLKDVLDGHTQTNSLKLGDRQIQTTVPEPEVLLLTKLCALHNRDLCYRSFHDGVAMMHIGHQRVPQLWMNSQSYYHRKASKDLYDCAELTGFADVRTLARLIKSQGLEKVFQSVLDPVDPAVREGAGELAEHVDLPDPTARLSETLKKVGDSLETP